ncbi:hypothetical protein ID866_8956 [Astraeus odoratus]|nr:hypothetical protein ID866_8956 [Astraeus odoratus]
MPNKSRAARAPRKQKRRSLASRAHLDRLMKEAIPATADADCDEPSLSASPSASMSSSSGSILPCENSTDVSIGGSSRGARKSSSTLNYANVLLIERFQVAVENRTAVCRRLEQLIRSSPMYPPTVQSRLIRFLRDDFIRGDRTLQVIENLRHSDFISASSSEDGVDTVREEVSESTKKLFEGSRELMVIGEQIATHFS